MSGLDCNPSAGGEGEETGGAKLYWPDNLAKFVSSRSVSDLIVYPIPSAIPEIICI